MEIQREGLSLLVRGATLTQVRHTLFAADLEWFATYPDDGGLRVVFRDGCSAEEAWWVLDPTKAPMHWPGPRLSLKVRRGKKKRRR